MSHTKAGGSTRNGRDSASKRLGVKRFGGQSVKEGEIIIRQRGTSMVAGQNIIVGTDFTFHAAKAGVVQFKKTRKQAFTGLSNYKTEVSVV